MINSRHRQLRAARLRRLKRYRQFRHSHSWLKVAGLRLILPLSVLGCTLWQFHTVRPRLASLPPAPSPTVTITNLSPSSAPSPLTPANRPTSTLSPTPTLSPASTLPSPSPQPAGRSVVAPPIPRQIPTAVAPSNGPTPEIRVAIAQAVTSFPISTSTSGFIRNDDGQVLGQVLANNAVQVQASLDGGLLVGEVSAPTSVWIQAGGDGHVFLDGRWYRGRLRLIAAADGLLAVNYVDLEQYVTSVVGAEVYPSWPIAALKAQAIAARSYAVAHAMRPANPYFDLGNTQRWQVYQGIEDEWNTTATAAKLTRGVVLSHQGTVMVSMYAATDEIVQEAFGGKGMSQTGAYELANQGYNYLQILGAYYPGAGLAQLRVK